MPSDYVSPIKAIKAFCVECMGRQPRLVKDCTSLKCPLYAYRLGRNPFRTPRVMSEEDRAKAAERLAKAREEKKKHDAIPKSEN